MKKVLTLEVLPETLALARLSPAEPIPPWALKSSFFSITRTSDELSIVCVQAYIPPEVKVEKEWRAFKVKGPLDFGLTGILASLTSPLAEVGVSIFAVSTFDTDYLLVKDKDFEKAKATLGEFGHQFQNRI